MVEEKGMLIASFTFCVGKSFRLAPLLDAIVSFKCPYGPSGMFPDGSWAFAEARGDRLCLRQHVRHAVLVLSGVRPRHSFAMCRGLSPLSVEFPSMPPGASPCLDVVRSTCVWKGGGIRLVMRRWSDVCC